MARLDGLGPGRFLAVTEQGNLDGDRRGCWPLYPSTVPEWMRTFTCFLGLFSRGFPARLSLLSEAFHQFSPAGVFAGRLRLVAAAGAREELPLLCLRSGFLPYLHNWNCFPQSSQFEKGDSVNATVSVFQLGLLVYTRFLQVQVLFRYIYRVDSHQVVCTLGHFQ